VEAHFYDAASLTRLSPQGDQNHFRSSTATIDYNRSEYGGFLL